VWALEAVHPYKCVRERKSVSKITSSGEVLSGEEFLLLCKAASSSFFAIYNIDEKLRNPTWQKHYEFCDIHGTLLAWITF
jgi:hypothetical protein